MRQAWVGPARADLLATNVAKRDNIPPLLATASLVPFPTLDLKTLDVVTVHG